MKALDLRGQRFTRLAVVGESGTDGTCRLWMCLCDCGVSRVVKSIHLRSGNTKSCGCLQRDVVSKRNHRHGLAERSSKHRLYGTWKTMTQRCHNPHNRDFHLYGGRGITVCGRWRESFANFVADVGEKPSLVHSLDRKDNEGGYGPENFRWATPKEQASNRRPRKQGLGSPAKQLK